MKSKTIKKKVVKKHVYRCVYEKDYDFQGVEFVEDGEPIYHLFDDTREKSEKIIEFINKIISHIQRNKK